MCIEDKSASSISSSTGDKCCFSSGIFILVWSYVVTLNACGIVSDLSIHAYSLEGQSDTEVYFGNYASLHTNCYTTGTILVQST